MAVELGFMGRVECQPKTPATLLPEAFVVDLPFAWNLLVPVIYPLALSHLQLHFQNDALKLQPFLPPTPSSLLIPESSFVVFFCLQSTFFSVT